ncbi:MAG: alpha/beta fold hydrolase [Oculatellaceae cyanobacterium bins.114]|nr:alpha/beta fold hydrolase [Oculatellaceae cyanobacterium bins.114]
MPKRSLHPWHTQLGSQRDWIWRGWQIRYTHLRPIAPSEVDAAPLVFLHGFGAALTQWRSNLIPLSQSRTVYALDFLGFGASEKAVTGYNVSLWAEQVYEFWQQFIGKPTIFVGHSLGALVALVAAVNHPGMAKGLVLITLPSSRQELLFQWLQPIVGGIEGLFASPLIINPLFRLIRQPSFIRSVLHKIYTEKTNVTDDLVTSFALPAIDRGAAKVLVRLVKARTRVDFSPDTRTLLPDLKMPVLVLWGDQDNIIPLTWGRQLPTLNPNLRLVELPGAGHCSYDECADRVNDEILTWIRATIETDTVEVLL